MNNNRTGILFVCESVGSLTIAHRMATQYKFDCPLYLFTLENLLQHNVHLVDAFDYLTTEPYTLPGTLSKIKLVLFGAHESSPHCRLSNAIGFLVKKTRTAHASLQHGWIQPGLNFETSTKRLDYRGFETDNSKSLVHFSDVLSFFGERGVGYPYPNERNLHEDSRSKILIATNFNWGIYKASEIKEFLEAVKLTRETYPGADIVHRPHPAEKKEQIQIDWQEIYEDYNVKCTRDIPKYRDLSWPSLVISTPSTIALDYVTSGTPTIFYTPKIFDEFIKALSFENQSFTTPEQLGSILNYQQIKNPCKILRFPSPYFAEKISALIENNQEFELSEEVFFRFGEFLRQ
ncbi:hypothetical protein [Pseudomonas sp. FYR_7]|uniref:hypothetical protein n=1 Tax=Pseudomonas sp. FYR_7 TaxID=3367174 RepID=UPI00370C3099